MLSEVEISHDTAIIKRAYFGFNLKNKPVDDD